MEDFNKTAERIENEREATLNTIKEKMEALEKEMAEAGANYIRQVAQDAFDKYPELRSFGWTQYTPYFNDGDTCIFAAHTDDIAINGGSPYELINEVDENGNPVELSREDTDAPSDLGTVWYRSATHWSKEGPVGWVKGGYKTYEPLTEEEIERLPWRMRAREEISAMLGPLHSGKGYDDPSRDSFFLKTFGDHCMVTIARDGYDTEWYEHE